MTTKQLQSHAFRVNNKQAHYWRLNKNVIPLKLILQAQAKANFHILPYSIWKTTTAKKACQCVTHILHRYVVK